MAHYRGLVRGGGIFLMNFVSCRQRGENRPWAWRGEAGAWSRMPARSFEMSLPRVTLAGRAGMRQTVEGVEKISSGRSSSGCAGIYMSGLDVVTSDGTRLFEPARNRIWSRGPVLFSSVGILADVEVYLNFGPPSVRMSANAARRSACATSVAAAWSLWFNRSS
jgi:hypothetical protein